MAVSAVKVAWAAALAACAWVRAAGAQVSVTRDFRDGRWSATGNCADNIDFYADGSFVTSGGARGSWVLQGDTLRFIGNSEVSARVHAPDSNSVILTHPDGSIGRSTRCSQPAAQRRSIPPLPASEAEALRISRPSDRSFLIGVWTDTGDCGENIRFNADGTFHISDGSGGRWTLTGERLSFIGTSTVTARARAVGHDRIILIHEDYSIGQSIRC